MRSPVYSNLHKERKRIKLSVLICTLRSRKDTLHELLEELNYQIQTRNVQVLWLGDNKSMSVGEKRNKLLSIADGDYVCFIDDDDLIEAEYIQAILEAIETGKPLITFHVRKTEKSQPRPSMRFSCEYPGIHRSIRNKNGLVYHGYRPDHLCVWKRELALKAKFPDINQSEDHRWAAEMWKHYTIQDQHIIEKELYWYRSDSDKSETRK